MFTTPSVTKLFDFNPEDYSPWDPRPALYISAFFLLVNEIAKRCLFRADTPLEKSSIDGRERSAGTDEKSVKTKKISYEYLPTHAVTTFYACLRKAVHYDGWLYAPSSEPILKSEGRFVNFVFQYFFTFDLSSTAVRSALPYPEEGEHPEKGRIATTASVIALLWTTRRLFFVDDGSPEAVICNCMSYSLASLSHKKTEKPFIKYTSAWWYSFFLQAFFRLAVSRLQKQSSVMPFLAQWTFTFVSTAPIVWSLDSPSSNRQNEGKQA